MGIDLVVSCDRCRRVLEEEDYAQVQIKLDINYNYITKKNDHRDSKSKIFCIPCNNIVWPILLDELTR